jgi:predicted nucleic acid-binding protein
VTTSTTDPFSATVRTFVDTNVWVYAADEADPDKNLVARRVTSAASGNDIVVSTQVMGEYYTTVTRKLRPAVPAHTALAVVEQMARLPVVVVDAALVVSAIAASREWQVSYWDALILRAAEVAGCGRVLSEDLAGGRSYGSIVVTNPFV